MGKLIAPPWHWPAHLPVLGRHVGRGGEEVQPCLSLSRSFWQNVKRRLGTAANLTTKDRSSVACLFVEFSPWCLFFVFSPRIGHHTPATPNLLCGLDVVV